MSLAVIICLNADHLIKVRRFSRPSSVAGFFAECHPSFTGYGMRLLVFGFVVTYSISLFSFVFLIMKTDRIETVLKFK
jgi:hypothetical protein